MSKTTDFKIKKPTMKIDVACKCGYEKTIDIDVVLCNVYIEDKIVCPLCRSKMGRYKMVGCKPEKTINETLNKNNDFLH